MTLFNQLTPQAQQLIEDHSELINKHLEDWIKNELKVKGGIAGDVIEFLFLRKQRINPNQKPLKLTPDRKRLIESQIRSGNGVAQFMAVIAFKVKQWGDDPQMKKYLTPETLFRKSKFQKYLEEAREDSQRKIPFTNAREYH